MISDISVVSETTLDKDSKYHFVDKSTPRQEILEKNNGGIKHSTPTNLIQRNWKLITILLLLLSCIVLSFTYCQPIFIRIRDIFTRLMSTLQPISFAI